MLSRKYIAWYLVIAGILPIVWALTGDAVWVLAFIAVVCLLFMLFIMFTIGGRHRGSGDDHIDGRDNATDSDNSD